MAGSVIRCELSGFDHEAEVLKGQYCQIPLMGKAVGCDEGNTKPRRAWVNCQCLECWTTTVLLLRPWLRDGKRKHTHPEFFPNMTKCRINYGLVLVVLRIG